jgi:hypothetical protein
MHQIQQNMRKILDTTVEELAQVASDIILLADLAAVWIRDLNRERVVQGIQFKRQIVFPPPINNHLIFIFSK